MSQDDLAKVLGTKGPAIGRYERDEMKPSIEAASKMAQPLDVSLDWLTGQTDLELDKKMIQRFKKLPKWILKPKSMSSPY
jgi:transcriptional regulator with XRE-family HTH domain